MVKRPHEGNKLPRVSKQKFSHAISEMSLFGKPVGNTLPSATPGTGTPAANTPAGGLFGNTQSTAPATNNTPLYPNLGSTTASTPGNNQTLGGSATGGGGLFASLKSTTSTGGATTTPAPPALGGLFGGTKEATTTPAAGLFGGTKDATKGGLFGNTQAAPKPAATGGLFPAPAAPQQPHKSFIGTQDVPAQQQPQTRVEPEGGQTAYFNSLLEKNKKRMREDEKNGFSGMPKIELGLGDISRRVRELGGVGAGARGDKKADSKAHYLLAASGVNPGATLRDLNNLNNTAGAPPTQAIPEWDPDSRKYVEQLQQQATLKMISEGIERAHRNFDAYLEDHVDMNWDEQRKKVYEHFGLVPRGLDASIEGFDGGASRFAPGVTGSFGRSAKKSRAGGPNTPTRSVLGASGLQRSVLGTGGLGSASQIFGESGDKQAVAPSLNDERYRMEKENKFAEKVQHLNEARLMDKSYPIFQEFNSVETTTSGTLPPEIRHSYQALIEIVGEGKEGQKIKQRQFMDEYLDETSSGKTSAIRKRILDGSRRALERKFYQEAVDLAAKNPREAALGGIPSVLNQVRAYIRVKDARKDLKPDATELQDIDGDYCWAVIFYLLRSGHVREAAKYVADQKQAFQALDRNFITYISSYVNSSDQRLPRTQQDKMNAEYSQRVRIAPEGSLDPYRMACYKVIGRCELGKRTLDGISQSVEDWTWLQFALARESNRVEEIAAEVYSLEDVRHVIREIGQRHFAKGQETNPSGYGTYFYLQVLAGLFENAVDFLYSHAYISAVHFAISLDYYGLFRVSDFHASETELLTYTTKDQPQINFGRMLGYYTRDFRAANATAATDYLSLIYIDADLPGQLGKSQGLLCHEALRELILETREFAQLLGDIRADGTRIRGAIEHRLPLIGINERDDYLRTVTLQAAASADDSGRTTDAVLLYHLSDDFDTVISIINRALSDACAVDLGAEPFRIDPVKPRDGVNSSVDANPNTNDPGSSFSLTAVDDPVTLARNFMSLYGSQNMFLERIGSQNREVVVLLIRIAEVRDRIEKGNWGEAINGIRSLDLLPLDAGGRIPTIRARAQNLASLPPTVSRLVGPLLLWSVTAISRQREILLGQGPQGQAPFASETRNAMREELVGQAKDLMTFAGLISFRLPKGVWDGVIMGAGEMGVH